MLLIIPSRRQARRNQAHPSQPNPRDDQIPRAARETQVRHEVVRPFVANFRGILARGAGSAKRSPDSARHGQFTSQQGIHSRWEAELFERNRTLLKIAPPAVKPVSNPRDFMFETLLTSSRSVANVLDSDKKAAEGREFYDDAYFDTLAKGTLPTLEKRLNDSIAAVAGVIIGAWEQAGRPALPTGREPRTPRRIRRPNP